MQVQQQADVKEMTQLVQDSLPAELWEQLSQLAAQMLGASKLRTAASGNTEAAAAAPSAVQSTPQKATDGKEPLPSALLEATVSEIYKMASDLHSPMYGRDASEAERRQYHQLERDRTAQRAALYAIAEARERVDKALHLFKMYAAVYECNLPFEIKCNLLQKMNQDDQSITSRV